MKVSEFQTLSLLQLPSNGLKGECIPSGSAFGSATYFAFLLPACLTGPLLPALSGLVMLEVLDLHGNELVGPVLDVSRMSHLRVLDLSANQVSDRTNAIKLNLRGRGSSVKRGNIYSGSFRVTPSVYLSV